MKDFELNIKFSDILIALIVLSLSFNILLIRELNNLLEAFKKLI